MLRVLRLMALMQISHTTDEFGSATWLHALLTCGHFEVHGSHPQSSNWDFPDEERTCGVCHKEVQIDLRLQVALTNDDEIDAEERTP